MKIVKICWACLLVLAVLVPEMTNACGILFVICNAILLIDIFRQKGKAKKRTDHIDRTGEYPEGKAIVEDTVELLREIQKGLTDGDLTKIQPRCSENIQAFLENIIQEDKKANGKVIREMTGVNRAWIEKMSEDSCEVYVYAQLKAYSVNSFGAVNKPMEYKLLEGANAAYNRADEAVNVLCRFTFERVSNDEGSIRQLTEYKQQAAENVRVETPKEEEAHKEQNAIRSSKLREAMPKIVISVIACAVLCLVYIYVLRPQMIYNAAVRLYEEGNRTDAYVKFSSLNRNYKDAYVRAKQCDADHYYERGNYRIAAKMYGEIPAAYRTHDAEFTEMYAAADELYRAGDILGAEAAFTEIEGYEDTAERAKQCREAMVTSVLGIGASELADLKVGDIILLGSRNESPIEWKIIKEEDRSRVLLAVDIPDRSPYGVTKEMTVNNAYYQMHPGTKAYSLTESEKLKYFFPNLAQQGLETTEERIWTGSTLYLYMKAKTAGDVYTEEEQTIMLGGVTLLSSDEIEDIPREELAAGSDWWLWDVTFSRDQYQLLNFQFIGSGGALDATNNPHLVKGIRPKIEIMWP